MRFCERMSAMTINGVQRQFPQGLPANLSDLLRQLDINAATVVAEVDGQIVERRDYASAVLREGQTIELIRFVGGG